MGCLFSQSAAGEDSGGSVLQPKPRETPESRNKPELNNQTSADNSLPRITVTPVETSVPEPKVSSPVIEFQRFTRGELAIATEGFSRENIVYEGGGQAPNVVYRGVLNGKEVAVKSFPRQERQNEEQFIAEAEKIGKISLSGVVPLLGFCTEDNARLLVAAFMPQATLSKHLFHYEQQPMAWPNRLNVSTKVAQALHDLKREGMPVYHDLNAYQVLFDKNAEPRLSCFGLMTAQGEENSSSNLSHLPPEYYGKGSTGVTAESIVYSFGTMLLALLSGKNMRPNQFLELVQEQSTMNVVVDSALMERPGADSAMDLIPLVAKCLQPDPSKRPSIEEVLAALQGLDPLSRITSLNRNATPGSPNGGEGSAQLAMAAFGVAASKCDLEAIHSLLAKALYGTPPQEPSFEMWNPEMQVMLDARKKGDKAFKARDWQEAIFQYNLYLQLNYPKLPLLYARRALCYLQLEQCENALKDAMTVQFVYEGWPEGYYLQAATLKKLKLQEDAKEMLAKGALKELERQNSADLGRSRSRSRSRSPSQSPKLSLQLNS